MRGAGHEATFDMRASKVPPRCAVETRHTRIRREKEGLDAHTLYGLGIVPNVTIDTARTRALPTDS
jgi:hypothetical protein